MSASRLICSGLLIGFFCVVLTSCKEESDTDPNILTNEADQKFFWFKTENGTIIKAYLEEDPTQPLGRRVASYEDIHYYLYTWNNYNAPDELTTNCDSCLTNWDINAPVKIICHGFADRYYKWPLEFKNKYLNKADYNIIVVNWDSLSIAPFYGSAVANVFAVGWHLAQLIDFLVQERVTTVDKIHFIGHSLGAHVGATAGSNVTVGKIGRITALDPAGPLFTSRPDSEKIDASDADFVDVIHTCGGNGLFDYFALGLAKPCGHADFYPNNNGRHSQPGCGWDFTRICSHSRAHEFFEESIEFPWSFKACKCDDWNEYNSGWCSCTTESFMGDSAPQISGLYFLQTNPDSPYGQS